MLEKGTRGKPQSRDWTTKLVTKKNLVFDLIDLK